MSSQSSQWVRRSSPKQGPLKATLPMSSLTRQNSNLNKSINSSPTSSPTSFWKTRVSPDSNLSGIRSPGSVNNYKDKSKTLNSGVVHGNKLAIRRTASLDTIYLTGQWPRETLYLYCGGYLQVDRSTQTDEWFSDPKKRYQDPSNDDKLEKYIRQRIRSGKESSCRERTAAFSLLGNNDVNSGMYKHRMRSSIEGLNQEIEKLVLRSSSSVGADKDDRKSAILMTPEGHRAPLADLLRQTRSVNTQTPALTTSSTQSSGPPSRESGSPLLNNHVDSRSPSDIHGSEDSSPEHEGRNLGTSPRINRFLAREPPDGCERVSLKFIETDSRKPIIDISEIDYPLKPSTNFQLKPSLGSAFQPLRSVSNESTSQ